MTPRQLSHELREETSPDLTRRRWVIGLSFLGAAAAKTVALFQTGIIRRLPDPPIPGFDSTKVDASDYAYKRLQTPDAFMMLTSYAVTAWLAGAGGKERARDNPAIPIAVAVKTLVDTAVAVELTREEWRDNKALCTYCQAATLASVTSVVLALPEAIRAVRNLFGGRRPAGAGVAGRVRDRIAEAVGAV